MTTVTAKHILAYGIAIVLIFVCGFGLSRSGKPYGTAIFTVHKLASVAVLVWLGLTSYRMHQTSALSAPVLLVVILAMVLLVGTMATGGALSVGKPMPPIVRTLHQITPYLTTVCSALAVFLLARQ